MKRLRAAAGRPDEPAAQPFPVLTRIATAIVLLLVLAIVLAVGVLVVAVLVTLIRLVAGL